MTMVRRHPMVIAALGSCCQLAGCALSNQGQRTSTLFGTEPSTIYVFTSWLCLEFVILHDRIAACFGAEGRLIRQPLTHQHQEVATGHN